MNSEKTRHTSWWRHQMESFSALLALCVGNLPVPVNSPHKGQWGGALMFSLICVWINGWVNNREAGDLRRHRCHYDVNVMFALTGELWRVFPGLFWRKKYHQISKVHCICRYELREDRKREAARTTGHIDNLKRDILRSLRNSGVGSGPPEREPRDSSTERGRDGKMAPLSPTLPHSSSGILSYNEMETLKREIVAGIRAEMRELAREMANLNLQNARGSPVNPPQLLPPINSELYHTHLYTQLWYYGKGSRG